MTFTTGMRSTLSVLLLTLEIIGIRYIGIALDVQKKGAYPLAPALFMSWQGGSPNTVDLRKPGKKRCLLSICDVDASLVVFVLHSMHLDHPGAHVATCREIDAYHQSVQAHHN